MLCRDLSGSENHAEERGQEEDRMTFEPLDPTMPDCQHPRNFQLLNSFHCFHQFCLGFRSLASERDMTHNPKGASQTPDIQSWDLSAFPKGEGVKRGYSEARSTKRDKGYRLLWRVRSV